MKFRHLLTAWIITVITGTFIVVLIFISPSVLNGHIGMSQFVGGYFFSIIVLSIISFIFSIPSLIAIWFTYRSLLNKGFERSKIKNYLSVAHVVFAIITLSLFLSFGGRGSEFVSLLLMVATYTVFGVYAVRKAYDWADKRIVTEGLKINN